jgi:hypothetical protein
MPTMRPPSGSGIVGRTTCVASSKVPGADPDREGDREPADEREARVPGEHPEAELEVEPRDAQVVEAAEPARPSPLVAVPLHAPELAPRLPHRLRRREPPALEIGRAQLAVEPELLLHLRLQLRRAPDAAPERAHAGQGAGDHRASSGVAASARAIACARWFHVAVSSPSRARPAAVSE